MNGREPCGDFKFSKIIQVCHFNPLIWPETALKKPFSLNEVFLV